MLHLESTKERKHENIQDRMSLRHERPDNHHLNLRRRTGPTHCSFRDFVLSCSRDLHLIIAIAALSTLCPFARAETPQQQLFERVFGNAVKLDPAMIAKAKAAKPYSYVLVDTNGDGRHDEAWFIDLSPRHTPANRPILVRAIDEDGDLDADGRPDLDSDLYVADWHADGTVDVVIDYQDNDHDNDVDEMGVYFFMKHHPFFGDDVLRVWWGRDDGDDNQLWYDEDYTYYQDRCQYRCHFSGDETFVAFGLTATSKEWLSAFENPFLFYDKDGDGCSEVVLRIEGKADAVRAIRYSFDADDDASGRRTHDYDFSITAHADEKSPITIPADLLESTTLRGIPTQGWLRRDKARAFVENAPWADALLTWDELNANTEENVARDPNERWEGVIAHGNSEFKQVGGPPCSVFNKRYELCLTPKPPLRLYFTPADGRMHLAGATRAWLDVDYNLDGKLDAKYEWHNLDGDGYLEKQSLDLEGDGRTDFDWTFRSEDRIDVPLMFDPIRTLWKREMRDRLDRSQVLIDDLFLMQDTSSGDKSLTPQTCPITRFFRDALPQWMPQTHLGARVRSTPAGALYYQNLIRDRLLVAAWKGSGAKPETKSTYERFSSGELSPEVDALRKHAESQRRRDLAAFGSFQKRIPLTLTNTGEPQRDGWPITLRVEEIRRTAPDFNPENCAVVAPHRWIDWRQIPHQVDTLDAAAGPELSFIADIPADTRANWYIYYSPAGRTTTTLPARTATAQDWVPPNIGWESERGGYRAYWGQFDFFGKKLDRLVYPSIGKASYHYETDWGIDALSTAKTGGIGGITLYRDDLAIPVWNPVGKGNIELEKQQLFAGPVRAAIRITARHVLPDETPRTPPVVMTCLIYAGRQESEVRVTAPAGWDIAPGLNKLAKEKTFFEKSAACLGTWGYQLPEIGEIGMALLCDPADAKAVVETPDQRNLRLRAAPGDNDSVGTARYWLIGDWRRGRPHPVAPTVDNWSREISQLAAALNSDVSKAIGTPETVHVKAHGH